MAEFITENPILDIPEPQNKDTKVLANLREISVGTGTEKFSVDIQKGMFLGSDKFDTAPFRVDLEGNIIATSGTFSGNTNWANVQAGTNESTLNVGAGNVKIDGANKRILINDGVNDRVLLGFLPGKF